MTSSSQSCSAIVPPLASSWRSAANRLLFAALRNFSTGVAACNVVTLMGYERVLKIVSCGRAPLRPSSANLLLSSAVRLYGRLSIVG
eukprot:2573767-Pyramimonas_sp.AAC.1